VVAPGGTVATYAWDMMGGGFPGEPIHAESAFTGTLPMFQRAGFEVVVDHHRDRVLLRGCLGDEQAAAVTHERVEGRDRVVCHQHVLAADAHRLEKTGGMAIATQAQRQFQQHQRQQRQDYSSRQPEQPLAAGSHRRRGWHPAFRPGWREFGPVLAAGFRFVGPAFQRLQSSMSRIGMTSFSLVADGALRDPVPVGIIQFSSSTSG